MRLVAAVWETLRPAPPSARSGTVVVTNGEEGGTAPYYAPCGADPTQILDGRQSVRLISAANPQLVTQALTLVNPRWCG
jgi:hypothetical protein